MAKNIKFQNAILCEHVVAGAFNKHTLINVYSGDVIVRDIPAQLTFGLYIEVEPLVDAHELNIQINLDKETKVNINATLAESKNSLSGVLAIPMLSFKIEKALLFEVNVSATGYRKTTALSKRIFQGEIPSS